MAIVPPRKEMEMENTIRIYPAKGLRIPLPGDIRTRQYVPEEGIDVKPSPYWQRLLDHGDVTLDQGAGYPPETGGENPPDGTDGEERGGDNPPTAETDGNPPETPSAAVGADGNPPETKDKKKKRGETANDNPV